MNNHFKQGWRNGLIGTFIASAVGLGFLMIPPFGRFFYNLSYDMPFLWAADRDPQEAVIVSIDERSYAELHQDQTAFWDRALHLRVVKELTSHGASAIVFDLLFDRPWSDPKVDSEFADAIRNHGRVVLAANLNQDVIKDRIVVTESLLPNDILGTNAIWGISGLPSETDQVIRKFNYDENYTNLYWVAANLLGKAPPDRYRSRWLNYYGREGKIRTVSFSDFYSTNTLPSDMFAGKVVFVGFGKIIPPTNRETPDQYPTPFTRWNGTRMSGVEIQATAFLNLWRSEWLTEFSPWKEFFLFLGTGALFGFGLVFVRPLWAVGLGVAGAFMVAVVGHQLVWHAFQWFPWMIISGAQIPAAIVWAALARTKTWAQEKEELEKKLESAIQHPEVPNQVARTKAESVPGKATIRMPDTPDYQRLLRIGGGTFGEVWLAKNKVGMLCAIKIVERTKFTRDIDFNREFHGVKNFMPISLEHPNWVQIYHVGDGDGFYYYVMEPADDLGTGAAIDPLAYSPLSLRALMNREGGHLSVAKSLEYVLPLADGLERLHQKLLIHRDLKPANIVFVKGVPKLADIGLVNQMGPGQTILGTVGFMAPEGPGTAVADLYSLGMVLYEISMGKSCQEFPDLPTGLDLRPDCAALNRLNVILLKACHHEPSMRYQSAAEFRNALSTLAQEMSANNSIKTPR